MTKHIEDSYMKYPFVFVGQGSGRPFNYGLECFVKFKDSLSDEAKKEVEEFVPISLKQNRISWNKDLLCLFNSDIGMTVKFAKEPRWYKKVSLTEAIDKDGELWTRPSKKSWDQFNHDLDTWVYGLHQNFPLEFFIKDFNIPKTKFSTWNSWSVERSLEEILPTLIQLRDSEDHRGLYSILNTILREYFKLKGARKLNDDRVVDLLLRGPDDLCKVNFEKLFFSFKKEKQNELIVSLNEDSRSVFLAALTVPGKFGQYLSDDSQFEKVFSIVKKTFEEGDKEIPKNLALETDGMTRIHQLELGSPTYLSLIPKKNVDHGARLLEMSLRLSEDDVFHDSSKRHIKLSALYFLAGEEEKAHEIARTGLSKNDSPEYRALGINYAKSIESTDLLRLYEN